MAAAVQKLYPDIKFGIGPAVDDGFYYDFDTTHSFSEEDFDAIEKEMRSIINKGIPVEQTYVPIDQAIADMKNAGQSYKVELLEEIKRGERPIDSDITSDGTAETASLYTVGNFIDLCKGPHVTNTKELPSDGFKLSRVAGAYWRGKETNPQLQRIYAYAFATQKELKTHLAMIEEAKKRDHRKLGKELDLFHIDDMVGLGLPLWHPKGALLWRVMEDFWYQKHLENGYSLVRTPHIGNRSLWETSGHWGFYNKTMYPPLEVGQTLEERQQEKKVEHSEEYLLKPMNCPFHVQIYKNSIRSYRELPYRWAECGTVYRFEKKGELSGLTRVRGFTQDDAHIICMKDQVEDELKRVIDFILFMYRAFGFDSKTVNVYLSLHDPNNKEKYAGDEEGWAFTEDMLRKVAKEKKLQFREEVGEAAFYGPKLDFKIKDVLGREWQCSTLQFDFNLPERFEMVFINKEGKEDQPFMLHRALFGSFERFIGLIIEHYGGAFPTWLSPVQVAVLPISDKFNEYAKAVHEQLVAAGIRTELHEENESVSKKIRNAELMKIPYIIVVGEKEVAANTVAVRQRGNGDIGTITLAKFTEQLKKEIGTRA